MSHRLYTVHIEREADAIVVAESPFDATRLAKANADDIFENTMSEPHAWVYGKPLTGRAEVMLPDGWEPECIPYVAADVPPELKNLTVAEWLALTPEQRGEPPPDLPGQIVMPFAVEDSP